MAKDCINIEDIVDILQVEKVKGGELKTADAEGGKKPYKFDTHKIQPYTMYNLLAGDSQKGESGPFKQIMKAVGNNNVIKRLTGSQNIATEKSNPLVDDLIGKKLSLEEKAIAGRRMQVRAIAMRHVIGSMKSEKDVEDKLSLSDSDKALISPDGIRNLSTVGMATSMGREIAYAMGYRLKKAEPHIMNKFYNDIGMKAMEEIVENTGLLEMSEDAAILNNKYMETTSKRVSAASILPGHDVVRINMDKLVDKGITAEELNVIMEDGGSIEMKARRNPALRLAGVVDATQRYIGRMSVPSNLQNPSKEPQKVSSKDIKMSTLTKDTLKEMQEKETFVNPKLSKFFLHLNKMVNEEMDSGGDFGTRADFQSILSSKFSNDPKVLNDIFGELDKFAAEDDKEQAVGQSLSKTNTLQTMIEMADQFFNEDGSPTALYFSHEMYRNGRVGFLETTMNAQTDKFFSRYAGTGGKVEVGVGSKEYEHLVRGIQDDAGFGLDDNLEIDLIRGDRTTPELDLTLKGYRKAFMDDSLSEAEAFSAQKAFMISLSKGSIYLGKKKGNASYMKMGGSIWQKLAVLEGIADIHDAKESGIVNTNFQTKPDATGSGIVLQLLQMMGLDGMDDATDKLSDLGLAGKGEKVLSDVYSFLENAIKKDTDGDITGDNRIANELITDMKDLGFFKSMRDIVKPTTMITSYMAGENTVVEQSGEAYADAIIKKLNDPGKNKPGSLDFAMKLVLAGDKKFHAKYIGDRSISAKDFANIPGVKSVLQKHLSKTAGRYSSGLIKEALIDGSMNKFQKKMKSLYANMEAIFKSNERLISQGENIAEMELRVLPAQVVLDMAAEPDHKDFKGKTHRQLLKDFGMPIMSAEQMMMDGKPPIVMKNTMNALTSLVNVIHSMDSAIMFNSHRETMKRIKEEMALLEKNSIPEKSLRYRQLAAASKMASHSVHDANNANPIYNTVFEVVYREQTEYAVQNYDMFDQMVKSYEVYHNWDERNNQGMSDGTADPKENDLQKLKDEAQRSIAFKKDFKLNYESDNIFGFKDGLPEAQEQEVVQEPTEEQIIANTIELEQDIVAEKETLTDMKEKLKTYKSDSRNYQAAMIEWEHSNYNHARPKTLLAPKITEKVIYKQEKLIIDMEAKLEKLKPQEADMSTPFDEGEGFAAFTGREPTANEDFDALMDEMQAEVDEKKRRKEKGETEAEYEKRFDEHYDNIEKAVEYWQKHSAPIRAFFKELKDSTGKKPMEHVFFGNEYSYVAKINGLTVPNIKSLNSPIGVYAMEHEIVHMKTVGYMAANPKDKYVAIINEAVDNIDNYKDVLLEMVKDNPFIQQRLNYAFSGPRTQLRAELVAVLGSEKAVAKRFVTEMSKVRKQMKNMEMVHKPNSDYGRLVLAAKNIVNKVKNMRFQSLDIEPDALIDAIARVTNAGHAWNQVDNKIAKEGRREHIRRRAREDGLIDKDGYIIDKKTGKATNRNVADESLSFAKKKENKKSENKSENKKTKPREAFNKQMDYMKYKPLTNGEFQTPFLDEAIQTVNMRASSLIGNIATQAMDKGAIAQNIENADKFLTENMPIYATNRDILLNVWDSHPFVSAMKGYINPDRFGDRVTMQQLLSASYEASAANGTMTSKFIEEMNNMMEGMSDEEVGKLYGVVSQAPIFNLIDDQNEYRKLIDGTTTVDELISKYEELIGKDNKRKAKRTAEMLTGKDYVAVRGDAYNLEVGISGKKERLVTRKLMTLYAIKNVDGYQDTFNTLNEKPELADRIMDAASGMRDLHNDLFSGRQDAKRYRENLVDDMFEKNYDVKALNMDEFNEDKYKSEDGWEILRDPRGKEFGIVYRPMNDETFQPGVGTNIGHRNADVLVHKSSVNNSTVGASEVITTDVGIKEKDTRMKLVLSAKEKETLGLRKNPADAFYRTYGRLHEIKATQASRDLLITAEFTKTLETSADLAAFDKELEGIDPKDVKWMLKLPLDANNNQVTPAMISKKIKGKHKYPNVAKHFMKPERASGVNGFRSNFDMVRKDANPWLFGYKDPVLFENNPQLRKTAYVVRQLVKQSKIVMVIVNPAKIAADMISNVLVLGGYNVPPAKMLSYGKDIFTGVNELNKLRSNHLDAIVHGNKAKEDMLKKQIDAHPQMYMAKNGMMQSINIEIMTRDSSVLTGLESDVNDLLHRITRDKEGKPTKVSDAIKAMVDSGWSLDGILEFAGKGVKNVARLEQLGEGLQESAKTMKKRSQEDTANYINEFLMTPGSQAVAFGSYMIQISDIVPRGILFQHLRDTGMKEAEAIATVSDAFIDYKQNMPKELKVLSDYGVLMFPSFWMRIQKVILQLAEKNPATMVAALAAEEALMLDIPSIFDANLVSKMTGEYGIVGVPPIDGFLWFAN